MKTKPLAATLATLLLASPFAAQAGTRVDFYGVANEEIEIGIDDVGEAKEDGTGYGVKGLFTIADLPLLLTAEYQSTELDDVDFDVNQYRGGIGWLQPVGALRIGGYAEYVKLEFESDEDSNDADGFGVHGRIEFNPLPALNLHAQAGYLRLDDNVSDQTLDGYEAQAGAAYGFTDLVAVFADYRYTDLEQDGSDITFSTVRAGVRFSFGKN